MLFSSRRFNSGVDAHSNPHFWHLCLDIAVLLLPQLCLPCRPASLANWAGVRVSSLIMALASLSSASSSNILVSFLTGCDVELGTNYVGWATVARPQVRQTPRQILHCCLHLCASHTRCSALGCEVIWLWTGQLSSCLVYRHLEDNLQFCESLQALSTWVNRSTYSSSQQSQRIGLMSSCLPHQIHLALEILWCFYLNIPIQHNPLFFCEIEFFHEELPSIELTREGYSKTLHSPWLLFRVQASHQLQTLLRCEETHQSLISSQCSLFLEEGQLTQMICQCTW